MFDLTYATRSLLCRAGFLAFCVLPTITVLAWAGWLHLPGHVAACRLELQQTLRLPVKLAAVAHPRPGRVVYEGLQIVDPESGATLASTSRLEAGRNGTSLVLIAGEVEIEAAAFERLRRLLEDRLREGSAAITLLASRVTYKSSDPPRTLEQVCAKIETLPEGPQFSLRFNAPEVESPQPMSFRLARVRAEGGLQTGLELDTGGAALPCAWAEPVLAGLKHLGPRAAFSGRILAFEGDNGWRGEMQGRLTGIELARLVGDNFPHRISGLAEVRIERARFSGGRLTDVAGRLTAGPGAVDSALLVAAKEALQSQLNEPSRGTPRESLLYEQLACDFRLNGQGLTLSGCCDRAPAGAVMVDASHWLLGEPLQQPQPAAGLIRALVPAGAVNVPASRPSGWLLDRLPLP